MPYDTFDTGPFEFSPENTQIDIETNLGWCQLDDRSLTILRAPNFEEYTATGFVLAQMRNSLPFWIGDYVNYGDQTFGERYTQVLAFFGEYSYQSVANYASVCRRVPAEIDGRPHRKFELSYSCHDAVARLDHDAQRYWLDRAVREGLDSETLRMLIAGKEPDQVQFVAGLDRAINLIESRILPLTPVAVRSYVMLALDALYDARRSNSTD
jgi:hypothetical protein